MAAMANGGLKDNLQNGETWIRFLYMVLFGAALYVGAAVLFLLVVVQMLFKLFTGQTNDRLAEFGDSLGAYFHWIIAFLSYREETKPFPFSPWPGSAGADTSGRPPNTPHTFV